VPDDLRHRAPVQRHDRCTGGHRLDQHHAERLVPADRQQQAAGVPQQFPGPPPVGVEHHLGARTDHRRDDLLEVPALDGLGALAGQHER